MVAVFLTQTISISDVKYRNKPRTVKGLIIYYAEQKELPVKLVDDIVKCESTYQAKPKPNITPKERSYGAVQINLLADPSVTIKQAEDPDFAINYLTDELVAGHGSRWSCYHSKK